MWSLFIISIFVFATLNNAEEKMCRKYAKLDTVENKAFLSPIIIIGNASMKIPIGSAYRMTIYIKSKVKGSFGNWKNNVLIAGDFSESTQAKNVNDSCSFQSEVNKEYIYFLKQSVNEEGAFDVVFKPILFNSQILNSINNVICKSCSGPPVLLITEIENTKDKSIFQCINTNKPSAKVKWEIVNRQSNVLQTETSNGGAQLKIIKPQPINEQMYVCVADSVAGISKAFLFYKRKPNDPTVRPSIIRCASNDKSLCSGKGHCYEDNGIAFCRCFQGYTNVDCSLRIGRSNSLERKLMLDGSLCSSNGYAYQNMQTKDTFCVCKEKFTGKTCAMTEDKSTSSNQNNLTPIIKSILVAATTKVAIIGALLVIGGAIFIIIVIVAIWRCYIAKIKSMDEEEDSKREENHKVTGSHRAPAYDEEVQLVPSTENKPPRGPVPPKNNYNGNNENKNDWELDMTSEKL